MTTISLTSDGVSIVSTPPKTKQIREHKGNSLLKIVDDYVVLDLETTGLDPRWDSIIEIGAIRIRDDGIVDEFQTLVNPGYPIDEFITDLTGITNDDLSTAPSIEEALPKAVEFVGKDLVIAHNANFDVNFLYDKCMEQGRVFSNDFIDTMRLSRRLFREHRHHRLIDLVQRFDIANETNHRALSDVKYTYECYMHMKSHITANDIDVEKIFSRARRQYLKASDISTTSESYDEDSALFEKCFVFTGILEKMVRKDAMQIVVNSGGIVADAITKKTDYLVLGNNDYCKSIKDGKSNKQKKAELLKLRGQDIEIISENVFYDMIDVTSSESTSLITDEELLIYESAKPLLLQVLESSNISHESLYITPGVSYGSIWLKSNLICRVKYRGKRNYIGLHMRYKDSIKIAEQSELLDCSIESDELFRRFEIPSLENSLQALSPILIAALEDTIAAIPKEFSCCSRYEECSDALKCINPNKDLAFGCNYKKILKSGRVFYGKNATI